MASKNQTSAEPSVLDAIKGAEEMQDNQAPEVNSEDNSEDNTKQPESWGLFTVEVGIAPPSRSQASSKYNWAEFPAPSNPDDPMTWPSVFIADIGGKTISGSIKNFRDRLQKEGKEAPQFTVSVSKEPKGVRVFRKK